MLFEVESANQYSEKEDKKRVVQIKILDVLYNDQVCDLIYMQDITKVYREQEVAKTRENILMATYFTSQELQAPQQTILFLTKQLIENCEERHRETLEAIEYGTNSMHLHI